MSPAEVRADLVDRAARAIFESERIGVSWHDADEDSIEWFRGLARHALAAVLPEIQAQALESLRDEFKTWHVYETRDMGDAFSSDLVIEEVEDRIAELHAARLTTTTEGSDV